MKLVFAVALAVAIVAAAACGGDGITSADLERLESPAKDYSISLPEGWRFNSTTGNGDATTRSDLFVPESTGGEFLASVNVATFPDPFPQADDFEDFAKGQLETLQTRYSPESVERQDDREVAGENALIIALSTAGEPTIDTWAAYFRRGSSAWVITLQFLGDEADDFAPLLHPILDSFELLE